MRELFEHFFLDKQKVVQTSGLDYFLPTNNCNDLQSNLNTLTQTGGKQ